MLTFQIFLFQPFCFMFKIYYNAKEINYNKYANIALFQLINLMHNPVLKNKSPFEKFPHILLDLKFLKDMPLFLWGWKRYTTFYITPSNLFLPLLSSTLLWWFYQMFLVLALVILKWCFSLDLIGEIKFIESWEFNWSCSLESYSS